MDTRPYCPARPGPDHRPRVRGARRDRALSRRPRRGGRRRRRPRPLMLTLEGVTAGYGDTTVLRDVSLEVRRGEAVALLGRNGMGKTTTLLATMGLNPARAGRIAFKGTDITSRPPFEIARLGIGYAPEGRHLFAPLTVLQNLRIPFVNKHPDRASWPAQLERVFALFPVLRERRGQRAGSLSGGEQQMLAIARALVGGDELLVLDEPTEGLAPTA